MLRLYVAPLTLDSKHTLSASPRTILRQRPAAYHPTMNANAATLRADASSLYNHEVPAARRWSLALTAAADAVDRGGLPELDAEIARWDKNRTSTAGTQCRALLWARAMLINGQTADAEAANFETYFGIPSQSRPVSA